MTNTYGANNGLLIKSTYGNGAYVENVYDRYDRVTGIKYNGTQQFGYVYNANGLVSKHTDNINSKTYTYTYDLLGRLQRTDISDGSYIGYTYDNVNNTAGTSYKYNGTIKTTSYTHLPGGIVQNVTYPNGATKTRALNAHAQVRPSSLTTPTGKVWSINRDTRGRFFCVPAVLRTHGDGSSVFGIRGGTFISINNNIGDCSFRIDWDPEKGLHIQ